MTCDEAMSGCHRPASGRCLIVHISQGFSEILNALCNDGEPGQNCDSCEPTHHEVPMERLAGWEVGQSGYLDPERQFCARMKLLKCSLAQV
jgi:hypothetical protein